MMEVIKFLKDMINLPSLSGDEGKVAERLKEEFSRLEYDDIIEAGGNICGRNGSGEIIILYDAHMDVVEPGKGWDDDPFKVREESGWLYGRGTCDDKGSLASIIYGGAKVKNEGVTLYVLGSVREEVSEGNGLGEFLRLTGIKPDYVIIAEPSSLRVANGNRGRLAVRIDVKGEAGHASNPAAGKNAIYEAVHILDGIKKLNEELSQDSVVVTKIETPNKNINVIPEACSIYCDYRSVVGRTEEEIVGNLRSVAGQMCDVVQITPYFKPWKLDEGHCLVRAAMACLKEKLGKEELIMWNFCTNGSFTSGEQNIPTVGFGPGIEKEAHSANEKIKVDSIEKAVDFYSYLPEYILEYHENLRRDDSDEI